MAKTLYEYCNSREDLKHLLVQFNEEANGISVHDIRYNTYKPCMWYCKEHDYAWRQPVNNRILDPRTPCCDKCGKKGTPNYNFELLHPELMKDWDYEKNTIKPCELRPSSHARVHWKCHRCGNTWDTELGDRIHSDGSYTGCAACGEVHTTKAERLLTEYFSLYFKDVRKVKIEGVEFDISIPELGILIEYDGYPWHLNKLRMHNKKLSIANNNNLILINIGEYPNNDGALEAVHNQYSDNHNVLYHNVDNNYSLKGLLPLVIDYFNKNAKLNLEMPESDFIRKALESSKLKSVANCLWNSSEIPWIRNWIAPQDIKKAMIFKDTSTENITIKCPNCGREWETVIRYIKKQFRGCTKRAGGCGYQHDIGDMLDKCRSKDKEKYNKNMLKRRQQALDSKKRRKLMGE